MVSAVGSLTVTTVEEHIVVKIVDYKPQDQIELNVFNCATCAMDLS